MIRGLRGRDRKSIAGRSSRIETLRIARYLLRMARQGGSHMVAMSIWHASRLEAMVGYVLAETGACSRCAKSSDSPSSTDPGDAMIKRATLRLTGLTR